MQRQTFDLPGGRFHALVAGDGPPVVYLHGFPDHPPTCSAFLEELAARGRRVIAPWLRGYSPSPTTGPFDRATLVGDIAALIEQVAGKSDRVAGNSDRVAGKSDRVAGNSDRVVGTSELVAGKSDRVAGTSDLVAGTSDRVAGTSDLVAGTSDRVAGKSDRVAGKSDRVAGTSDLVAGNSDRVAGKSDRVAGKSDASGAPVDVVGHDWGAVITYALCAAHPQLVRRAVTMAVPHPRTFLEQARRRPRQLAASWYMGFFQIPGSERIVAARHFALIDRLWRKWSPSLTVSAEQRASLRECLAASWPAPLEYYRDMRRNARRDLPALRAPIEVPLLYLHGANDGCVLPPTVDDSDRFASEYEREIVDGVGHFMHVEDPSGLCDRIDDWFERPVRDAASA